MDPEINPTTTRALVRALATLWEDCQAQPTPKIREFARAVELALYIATQADWQLYVRRPGQ